MLSEVGERPAVHVEDRNELHVVKFIGWITSVTALQLSDLPKIIN